MRVVINARALTQSRSGVQRYAYEVIRRLPTATLYSPSELDLATASGVQHHKITIAGGMSGHLWEQVRLPLALKKGDFLWSPGGPGCVVRRAQALTIHDVGPIDHPEWYGPLYSSYYAMMWRTVARRGAFITTDSEFSRQRIAERLNIPMARIHVTYCGVDERFAPMEPRMAREQVSRLGVEGPFILAVAAISPRKNLARLCQAWASVSPALPDIQLLLVGQAGLRFAGGKGEVPDLPPRTVHLGHVPDAALPALYNAAEAFIYPSLYEGFGLPPLEAMSCGTPVIASNSSSLPEVLDRAALLVNPYDVEEMAEAIKCVLSTPQLRESLRGTGLSRAAQFRWTSTANAVWQFLDEMQGS